MGSSDVNLVSCENVRILPRGDSETIEEITDILVCILNSKGSQIPGKLYHCAATCKPVLVILDGDDIKEKKEYIDSFHRFITCENSEHSICDAIKYIIRENLKFEPCKCLSGRAISEKMLVQL